MKTIILFIGISKRNIDKNIFDKDLNVKIENICQKIHENRCNFFYCHTVFAIMAFETYCLKYGIKLRIYFNDELVTCINKVYAELGRPFLEMDVLRGEQNDLSHFA